MTVVKMLLWSVLSMGGAFLGAFVAFRVFLRPSKPDPSLAKHRAALLKSSVARRVGNSKTLLGISKKDESEDLEEEPPKGAVSLKVGDPLNLAAALGFSEGPDTGGIAFPPKPQI